MMNKRNFRNLPIRLITSFFVSSVVLLSVTGLYAQEKRAEPKIEEREVRVPRVNFINQTNRPATPAMRNADVVRGQKLAEGVLSNQHVELDGIAVKRVYDPASEGYGADLLRLTNRARYGHVFGIQRVLSGYLSRAFEYKEKDADTLALFILYYNAHHRGDMKAVKNKYSENVVKSVDPARLGIDRVWSNWSGKTELLIPLRKSVIRPGKTDIHTNEIKKETQAATKEEKKQLDKVQDDRKKDDIKKLDQKQQELKKEETKIAEAKKQVETKKQEVATQKTETDKKLQELRKDPVKNADAIKKEEKKQEDLKKEATKAEKKEEQLAKKEEQVKKQQDEVKKQKEETQNSATAGGKTETKKQEDNANKKVEEQKKQIDEQKEKIEALVKKEEDREKKSENVVNEKILFLRILRYLEGGHYNNELWQLDPVKDDALRRGPYTNICGHEFIPISGEGVLVIGYDGKVHNDEKHHLVMLDADSLELKKMSKEEIFWRTPMIHRDNKIYVLEMLNGQFYLSRFKPDLSLDARSSDPVSQNSQITFYNEKIYVTGKADAGGRTTIRIFQRGDLKLLKTIDPPQSNAGK